MRVRAQTKGGSFEFECVPGEPLLYAGLRAGISLPYECATGTCGTCRARVHEGSACTLWDEAPGLSYVKREKNEILMCQAAADAPCTLRIPAKVAGAEPTSYSPRHLSGRLGRVRRLTHDVLEFQVRTDAPMTFLAGQFAVLTCSGVTGGRAYSMVNTAGDTDTLTFVVKRKPDGKFSDWLFDSDVEGETVKLFGPLGQATFQSEEARNLLCIAGGSGIAGMMSILSRAAEDRHLAGHCADLFFGVRSSQDVFYLEELARLVEQFPDTLRVTVALSDEPPEDDLARKHPAIRFASGFVHSVASAAMAKRYENLTAYVAGPPPMVDGALRMLVLEARLPAESIRYDKFG